MARVSRSVVTGVWVSTWTPPEPTRSTSVMVTKACCTSPGASLSRTESEVVPFGPWLSQLVSVAARATMRAPPRKVVRVGMASLGKGTPAWFNSRSLPSSGRELELSYGFEGGCRE